MSRRPGRGAGAWPSPTTNHLCPSNSRAELIIDALVNVGSRPGSTTLPGVEAYCKVGCLGGEGGEERGWEGGQAVGTRRAAGVSQRLSPAPSLPPSPLTVLHRLVHVHAGAHDERALAAQLQRDGDDALRGLAHDDAPHLGGALVDAGKSRDLRVSTQRTVLPLRQQAPFKHPCTHRERQLVDALVPADGRARGGAVA